MAVTAERGRGRISIERQGLRAPSFECLGDRVETSGLLLMAAMDSVSNLVALSGSVNDVDAGVEATAGEGDIAFFEARGVGGVIQRPTKGRALHAVAGAGIAVFQPTRLEVARRQFDVPLGTKRNGEAGGALMDLDDNTGGTVLDEVTGVGATELAVVAASHHVVDQWGERTRREDMHDVSVRIAEDAERDSSLGQRL